jgi:hypothetical protein
MSRFTREAALWCAVAILAALPRLIDLHPPLANAEATRALLALAAIRGDAVSFPNPLFGLQQALSLAILGPSDASARLVSALAGTALCLAPILLRSDLGRGRALLFGALLALSPTLWFVSRQADGAMLAWLLAFGAFCAWRRRLALTCGALLGALLACGSDAVVPAIIAAIAAAVSAETRSEAAPPRPFARFALAAAGAFGIAATSALLRPSGLGDAFNGYSLWAQSAVAPAELSFGRLVAGFVVYEPLLLFGAIAGVAALLRRGPIARLELGWMVWLGLGLIGAALIGQRSAAAFTPVVIGCAAFGAFAFDRLLDGLRRHGAWSREGVIAAASTVLLLYAGLGLWQYAGQGQATWLYPIVIAGLLILAMIAAGGLGLDYGSGLRGTALAVAASVLLWSLAAGLRLTHIQPENPAEPYRSEAVGSGLSVLVETIRETGRRATGEPDGLGLQVAESAPPALRWALRDQRNARFGSQPTSQEGPSPGAALTPEPMQPPTSGSFIGQGYDVVTRAPLPAAACALQSQDGPTCQPLARWLAFREPSSPRSERWLFWLRDDVAVRASGQR